MVRHVAMKFEGLFSLPAPASPVVVFNYEGASLLRVGCVLQGVTVTVAS